MAILNTRKIDREDANQTEVTLIFFFSVHICSLSLMTLLRTPIKISVFILRSWASSIMITEYFFNRKSIESSRNRTPSVMNLIEVSGETVAS